MKKFINKASSSIVLGSTMAMGAAIFSGSALAHNNSNISFSGDSCNLQFQQTVRIQPNTVEIQSNQDQTMRIESNGALYINNQLISLENSEQQALEDYANNLRTQLPQVAEIALEGVQIAGVAIEEVGNAFGIDSLGSMEELMDELSVEIHDKFYQDGTFVMSEHGFETMEDTFGKEFEDKMEQAMEAAVMDSIGSLLIALGSELLGSGGDMKEFENRMENMGRQIEEKVELQAKNLEVKAEALCGSMSELAAQEDAIQEFLPQLKNYDLFAANSNN